MTTRVELETPVLSIVVPFHNEEDNVAVLHERLCSVLDRLGLGWELVAVNDGSRDGTLAALLALRERDARVQVIDLARNFGKEAALTAGLDFARGSAVIPLDADLQDPPEVIPALIAKWREGYDVVNAVRIARDGESWLKRATAHHFYRTINRMSHVEIPADTGDFRLITRPALDALKRLPERRRFMKGLFAWVGFRVAEVPYRRAPRQAGQTSWNYWKLWNFALEGITSFSTAPLRIATYLGLVISALAFAYAGVIATSKLVFGNPVAGYPSLMVGILFIGGVQLLSLGVIGEYIGRIYEETKQRPIYLLREPQITASQAATTTDVRRSAVTESGLETLTPSFHTPFPAGQSLPNSPLSRTLRLGLGVIAGTIDAPYSRALRITLSVIAIGLCWAYLYHPWLTNHYIFPYDAIDYFYPILAFTSQSLRHGQMPWWNPYLFIGSPGIADPQTLIFSPLVTLPMAATANPTPHWLDVIVLLNVALGGVGMFGLLRQMGLSIPAAIFGAIIAIGGGCLPARVQHTALVIATSTLPWVGWALLALCRRPTLWRGLALGVVVGWMGLHLVQTTFIALILVAIALVADVVSRQDPINHLRRLATPLLVTALVTIVICGPQVAVLLTFLPETTHYHMPLSASAISSAPFRELLTFVWPDAMHTFSANYHESIDITCSIIYCGYLAAIAFCLGLIVLGNTRLMPRKLEGNQALSPGVYRLSAILLAFSLLYALGNHTPFYGLLYHVVPGVSFFRRPVDAMFIVTLCLSPIAALGFERYLAWFRRRATASSLIAAAALPVVILCWDLGSHTLKPNRTNSTPASYATSLPDHYSLMDFLRVGTRNVGQPNWRVEFNQPVDPWPDLPAVAKLYSTQGYNPLQEARYVEVFGTTPNGYVPIEFSKWVPGHQSAMFGLLGVKYIVSGADSVPDVLARKSNLKLVLSANGMNVWESANRVPRLFSPSEAVAATAEDAPKMTAEVKDLAKTVVIESAAKTLSSCGAAPLRTIYLTQYHNTDVNIRTEGGPSSGWLVMTDPDTLGWHAYVDSVETRLFRADGYMRAVCVPAGSHVVSFRFEPFRQIAGTILHRRAP